MKKLLQIISMLVLTATSTKLLAQSQIRTRCIPNSIIQTTQSKSPSPGLLSEVLIDHGACISEDEQKEIQLSIDQNVNELKLKNPKMFQKSLGGIPSHPLFEWPTRSKAGFTDYGYYTVNFLVDQNLGFPNQLLDYNCGARTYDWGSGSHAGTDIILWPYAWRRMDEQVMEVIAAAPGIIVNKVDGNFDRNCNNNGSGTWNQINIRHADGSTAWYLHFKSGSLTTKSVGDSVITGEYLGTAGSSGSSSWPHLHFQVMDSTNALIDPWQGPCNSMNPDTWWFNQQPYNVPSVNRICTKKTQLDYYNCPNPEITYEADTFNLGDSLWLWIYTRDLDSSSTMQINIYNPSGQNVLNFPFTVPWQTIATTYLRWYYLVDPWFTQGNWTFEVVYNGITYQHPFYITQGFAGSNENKFDQGFTISPNPSRGDFQIEFKSRSSEAISVEIKNVLGERVLIENLVSLTGDNKFKINNSRLVKGVYFVQLKTGNKTEVKRLVIE